MALFKTTLLQIGDVHFPDWKLAASDVDLKVNEFSPKIVSDLQNDPLTRVLQGLRDTCRVSDVDAALLMGDMTSQGKTEYLENAALVISGLVNDTESERQIPVFGVPGNHDVNKADAVNLGDHGKFRPLERAFSKVKWALPPVQTYIRQEVSAGSAAALPIYLLNSSLGSWSKALYPEGLRELVFSDDPTPILLGEARPFGDALAGSPNLTRAEQVYEQLDTPYFRAADVQAIAEEVERGAGVAVVVAHHNILPQYTPRVSHFGEVLNAGYARQLFLATDATILYLHGHIHTDPVEVVTIPNERGVIVSIAAPVITQGFNVITLFRNAEGTAFAVKLARHRVQSTGLRATSSLIPLVQDRFELLKKGVSKFWNFLRNESGQRGEVFNWGEVLAIGSQLSLTGDELEAALLALFCASLINIRHFGGPVNAWRIELRD